MAIVTVVIPTLNAGSSIATLWKALASQSMAPSELVILDSESTDGSMATAHALGARVISVTRSTFHHATVRNQGASLALGDVLVFLTQDAIPADRDLLKKLMTPLVSGTAAASFARQLPNQSANPLERFARTTNYPNQSRLVSAQDIRQLGVRALFFSNSCSAVRRDAFEEVGGFPTHTIMNEDMLFAAKLLRAGHKVAYVAEAVVRHSHNYSLLQTFKRYFDIGVVFTQASEELEDIALSGDGIRYISRLFTSLWRERRYAWLVAGLMESTAKWVGLFLGKRHRMLPRALVRRLSMHRNYWA